MPEVLVGTTAGAFVRRILVRYVFGAALSTTLIVWCSATVMIVLIDVVCVAAMFEAGFLRVAMFLQAVLGYLRLSLNAAIWWFVVLVIPILGIVIPLKWQNLLGHFRRWWVVWLMILSFLLSTVLAWWHGESLLSVVLIGGIQVILGLIALGALRVFSFFFWLQEETFRLLGI
jgi:hypothetical protein